MRFSYLFALIFCGLFSGCDSSSADASTKDVLPKTTEGPKTGAEQMVQSNEEALTALQSGDPYTVDGEGAFLGMKVGESIKYYEDVLRDGIIRSGEGEFEVHYIDAAEGYELGYIIPESEDRGEIGQIIITSENVLTEQGIKVGMTFAELRNKLGQFKVYGSPIEARTYAEKDDYIYRLDVNSPPGELSADAIPATTKVLYISLPQ